MAFCPSCGAPVTGPSCPKCGAPTGGVSPVSMPSPASPYSSVPVGGNRLPDVSPLAIILALGAWVFGAILLSLPAMFLARSDIRGCREGRYNPAGLTQSQLAFWVAAINVAMCALVCLAIVGFMVLGIGLAGVAATSVAKWEEEARQVRVEMEQKQYSALETEIDGQMSGRTQKDRDNWKQVKKEWEALRRKGQVTGDPMPASTAMTELLQATSANARLWTALKVAEEKVAKELNYAAPNRIRSDLPAESTGVDDD